ncbi:MAG: hypothetical protein SPJ81_07295 [Lachnoclostridium sp.]|nr:hypothetical protein [Lachnoclostridium sp.]
MEKIISESTYFYTAGEENAESYRITLRLQDAIDGKLLQEAVDRMAQRYPYYMVKCERNEREYYLERNTAPIVVKHTDEPARLGSRENNEYLFAVTYFEDAIYLNMFHGLTDGNGAMEMLRTLVYYYCLFRYDASLSSEGIRSGTEIPEEEKVNPYEEIMSGKRKLPEQNVEFIEKCSSRVQKNGGFDKGKALNLHEDTRIHVTEPVHYALRISEKEMMQYCRRQDGSPGVVLSLMMARAIDRLNPENESSIVAGMAINLRPALDTPQYKGSPIGITFLSYDDVIKAKPFTTQATAYRGRLILASDKELLLAGVGNACKYYTMMDQLPTVEAKRAMANKMRESFMGRTSYVVSYVGQAKMGEAERYVKEIQIENELGNDGIVIEVIAANGYFFLEFAQQWGEELYFQGFCEELTAQGIGYEVLSYGSHCVPCACLP